MNRTLLLPAVAGILLLTACGDDDTTDASGGDARTIEVEMVDIAFEPDTIEVTAGETVRFVFTNTGDIAHDAYIGDVDAQDDHEAQMRDAEGGGHGGHGDDEDEGALTVEPGDTAEMTHTFAQAETLEIGCHQPGHYDAGMRITVDVQ
jgi:uncharacterized cupredoxin-like copper-binding protein